MTDAHIQDLAGLRVFFASTEGPNLSEDTYLSDLIGEAFSARAEMIAIPLTRLGLDFLNLKSGVAGRILQKLVNYHFRIAILGDVSAPAENSNSLREFIQESNRGRTVWFCEDLAALMARTHKLG